MHAKHYAEIYICICYIFVGMRSNNTGRHKECFKYRCLHHNDLCYRERWSNWMLQKIQILSNISCYLPSIRQNGFLRSILQSSGQKSPNVFIWLGHADIYTADLCLEVQTELSHWKTPIKESINKITFDKAMLGNYQSVRIIEHSENNKFEVLIHSCQ